MLAAVISQLVIVLVFIVLGIFLLKGKGAFLIAGYNTMPKEKREKFDELALCRFMGKMMFALAGSMFIWTVGQALEQMWIFYLGLAVFMGVIVFMLVYMNTGNHFQKGK